MNTITYTTLISIFIYILIHLLPEIEHSGESLSFPVTTVKFTFKERRVTNAILWGIHRAALQESGSNIDPIE